MITITILLAILVLIGGYAIYNLLTKNEKLEDIVTKYENYINNLAQTIDFSDKKLKEIDSKETFKSDDEIGWFFDQIKFLQEQLNNFKVEK